MQERTSTRPAGRPPRSSKKKNRQKNGSVPNGKFDKFDKFEKQMRSLSNGGTCQKCGHPAPDGKLCSFHRALLNSIRNDPPKDRQRPRSGLGPF